MAGGIGVPIGSMSSWPASAARDPTSSMASRPPNPTGAATLNCGGEKEAECGVPLAEEVAEFAAESGAPRDGPCGARVCGHARVFNHMNFKVGGFWPGNMARGHRRCDAIDSATGRVRCSPELERSGAPRVRAGVRHALAVGKVAKEPQSH